MNEEQKKTCFVIGPIGSAGSETRRDADFLLNGIVRHALKDQGNLQIWRADEESRPGMITDRLINDLYDSDLVIADLSELNPNAFYELGIRHAAGKPTIHLASKGTKLPFDNLGHIAIFFDKQDWDDLEAARAQLRQQVKSALEPDFVATNPVTQALNAKAFSASPQSSDKVIGELLRRMENLEISSTSISRYQGENEQSDSLREIILRKELTDFLQRNSFASISAKIGRSQIESYASRNSDKLLFEFVMNSIQKNEVNFLISEIKSEIPF